MSHGFRSNVWDPIMIVAQITALQCYFYFCLAVWLSIAGYICEFDMTLAHVFDYHIIGRTTEGWITVAVFAVNALVGAVGLWIVISRAKQCLDFTMTLFAIHLIMCCVYGGIPHSATWWIMNVVSLVVMVSLGEYLCLRSELAAIPVTGSTSGKT
ncbi:protein SYS1 homolog [Dysidea avara]|uniref:protein SYS1 homolog n=1 Tax=Dysidea avara TaxID=196820 RepID=UPI0033276C21